MSQFEIYFTTPQWGLWSDDDPPILLPDPDKPARKLGRAWQFSNASLDAPMNANPRQFDVKIPIYDKIHDEVRAIKSDGITAYSTFIYVEWRGHPVIWGPIVDPEWDDSGDEDTVNLRCYSQLKRAEAHYFREGDFKWSGDTDGITSATKFKATIPADYRGARLIRDTVEITPPQPYIPLGIKNGSNTGSTRSQRVEVERGQQSLRGLEDFLGNSWAPELLEVPLSPGEDPPYFAKINTADKLGTNRYDEIFFTGGFAVDNLQSIKYNPGGKIVTHAQVLDRQGKHRETRVNVDSATENGVWVDWVVVDFEVTTAQSDEVLGDGVAQTIIDHYGVPPKFAQLFLKKDDEISGTNQKYWLEDFFHGDYIRACYKKGGLYLPDQAYRITGIGLKQEDQDSGVRQSISVVPEVTGTYDAED